LIEHSGTKRSRVCQFCILKKPRRRSTLSRCNAKDGFCQRLVGVIATTQAILRGDAVIDACEHRVFLEKPGSGEIVEADSRIRRWSAIGKRQHVYDWFH